MLNSNDNKRHKLFEVNYSNQFPEINFFENIGRITVPKRIKYWCTNGKGNCSSIMQTYKNEQEWRKNYWSNFEKFSAFKYDNWEVEQEWRLIKSPFYGEELPKEKRIIHYDFEDLKGIIFGVKTTVEDKCKVIKIIEEKCRQHKRSNFKFYQSRFPVYKNKMEVIELNLLKFY